MQSKMWTAVGLVLLVGTLAAGAQTAPTTSPTSAPTTQPAARMVAAWINGNPLYEDDIRAHFTEIMGRRDFSPTEIDTMYGHFRDDVLRSVIERRLLAPEYKAYGTALPAGAADMIKAEFLAGYAVQGVDVDKVVASFEQQRKLKLDDIVRIDRVEDPLFCEGWLQERFIRRKFPEQTRVTDEQVREFYDRYKDERFTRPAEVHVRHILIGEPNMVPDARVAAENQAITTVSELRKDPRKFSDYVRLVSQCRSRANDGDLGWIPESGSTPWAFATPEFRAAVFALEPGQISAPIDTPQGISVAQVLERRPAEIMSFESLRKPIRLWLEQQQAQATLFRYFDELKGKANIVFAAGLGPKRSIYRFSENDPNPPAPDAGTAAAPKPTLPLKLAPGHYYVVVERFPLTAGRAAKEARDYLLTNGRIDSVLHVVGNEYLLIAAQPFDSEASAIELMARVMDLGVEYLTSGHDYSFQNCAVQKF